MAAADRHHARDLALKTLGRVEAQVGSPAAAALRIAGEPAAALCERFGSPLFVYDGGIFAERLRQLRDLFGPEIGVLFALKANPHPELAGIARGLGVGAEIASAGELRIARRAGFAGSMLQFAGPGKSEPDLRAALEAGARINLESEQEYQRLIALAGDRRPEVAIRVNPGAAPGDARLRMAEASSRFGVDRERVPGFAARILVEDRCELAGLHQHTASQCFDHRDWLRSASTLIELATEIEDSCAERLRSLNFGGGFGWPLYADDPELDLGALAAGLNALLEDAGRRGLEAWVEPGRWPTAGCGVYLCRVVDRKLSGGRPWLVLDGGMHQFGAAFGLGAPMRKSWAVISAADPVGERGLERVSIGGPLCTPADRLGKNLQLPRLEIGDLVAILNAGAYGPGFSPTAFLNHPPPTEVVIGDPGPGDASPGR